MNIDDQLKKAYEQGLIDGNIINQIHDPAMREILIKFIKELIDNGV